MPYKNKLLSGACYENRALNVLKNNYMFEILYITG
jgi:hypothetical protein